MQGTLRSRGCITCRRRKKGCDLRRPKCSRCLRFGVTCQYAEQGLLFVPEAGQLSRRTRGQHESGPGRLPDVLTGTAQKSLYRTERELQIEDVFWTVYLPEEDSALDGSVGGVRAAPWIPTVRVLAEGCKDLRTAVRACAFAGLGWLQTDHMLVQYAGQLYARALRDTNRALRDPGQSQSDNVLACCRVLGLFELFPRGPTPAAASQSQGNDWQSHVEGASRLVRLRGPHRHVSGHGLVLYDATRNNAAISGLILRRRNAFTSLVMSAPPQRTLRDELYDLMCGTHGLLEQLDSLQAVITGDRDRRRENGTLRKSHELLDRCVSTASSLQDWENKAYKLCVERLPIRADQMDFMASAHTEVRSRLLRDVCRSHGYGFFFICTQYWAVCVILYSSVQALSSSLRVFLHDDFLETPPWMDAEPHARCVADTVAHFFRPEAGLWSAQLAIFPVGTALSYFARTSKFDSVPFRTMIDELWHQERNTLDRQRGLTSSALRILIMSMGMGDANKDARAFSSPNRS